MKIGVAQIRSQSKDIEDSFEQHFSCLNLAAKQGCDFLVFPELSLTGYEPSQAVDYALEGNDLIFDRFQKVSNRLQIGCMIGFSLKCNSHKPKITAAIFQPSQSRQFYSKQFLHEDELPFFSPGDHQVFINTKDDIKMAPAICYECLITEHAALVNAGGAKIYCASVAKSQLGIDKANIHFPLIAMQYKMTIVMSNFVGPSDNFLCAGQSGVWDNLGHEVQRLGIDEVGVLVFDVT